LKGHWVFRDDSTFTIQTFCVHTGVNQQLGYIIWLSHQGLRAAALKDVVQGRPHGDCCDDEDIFLLIRQWMADNRLSQKPLVFPKAYQGAAQNFVNVIGENAPMVRPSIEDERARDLRTLAAALERLYGTVYQRGALFLRNIADCLVSINPMPKLRFLCVGARFDLHRRVFESPPDETFVPRTMRVVFKVKNRKVLDIE
jgi:hypothetical protein